MSDDAARELASGMRDLGHSIFQGAGVIAVALISVAVANHSKHFDLTTSADIGRTANSILRRAWPRIPSGGT